MLAFRSALFAAAVLVSPLFFSVLLLPTVAVGQSRLPPCPNDRPQPSWDNCQGTQAFITAKHAGDYEAKYVGEYKDGNVTIWGTASRDPQIGIPVGRTYMESIVGILPGADIKDSSDNPGNWYVRFNGRSTIPLKELLSRESEWISAMAQAVQTLQKTSTT